MVDSHMYYNDVVSVYAVGKSALHWAAAVNNVDAALVLLKNGANKDMQNNKVSALDCISQIIIELAQIFVQSNSRYTFLSICVFPWIKPITYVQLYSDFGTCIDLI